MSLQTQIKDEIKKSMLARDAVRTGVMRGLVAAFTNELVAKNRKPTEELADADALAVIKRMVKQRKDSIEQFQKGGRADLVASEQAELAILETFLPASMPREQIKKVAEAKKAELGVTDKAGMGKLIGAISKELKGQADGADIKAVVESLF
jgi:uncharacterized protein YqeY